ncbi:nodulin-related protein 1-like [Cornus florida]|uniref:nodulin-related protein 1-like n=1 Tax=Cornus florida TaxID=4283 RepID=UPI00289A3C98|nr:nodulin-related protein 1-like [Cornus florida]
MDLHSLHKGDKTNANHPDKHHQHQPTNAELMSSAKIVADAAKSSLGKDSSEVDKAKVAGATANLLNAANHYGKLDEKGYGKYIDKAEDYLEKYSHTSTTTTTGGHGHSTTTTTTTTSHSSSHSGGEGKTGGGYGDYLKMAQGFLKK